MRPPIPVTRGLRSTRSQDGGLEIYSARTGRNESSGRTRHAGGAEMKHRWWVWALIALGVVVLAAALGFVIWGLTPSGPMPEAVAALETDEQVTVLRDDLIVFRRTARIRPQVWC